MVFHKIDKVFKNLTSHAMWAVIIDTWGTSRNVMQSLSLTVNTVAVKSSLNLERKTKERTRKSVDN